VSMVMTAATTAFGSSAAPHAVQRPDDAASAPPHRGQTIFKLAGTAIIPAAAKRSQRNRLLRA